MREIIKGSMQLTAIILVLITIAFSTAAVSQWAETNAAHTASHIMSQTQTAAITPVR